jgi:hypothetical protein
VAADNGTREQAAGMGKLEPAEEGGILTRDNVDRLSARRERAHSQR